MAGFAEELRRIPMSQGLGETLARAADYAQAQQHGEVALEHLLLALTEDEDAAQVLAASHVDLALLKSDVSLYLGGLDVRHNNIEPGKITLAVDLKRILEAAAAAASQGRRREINGAIVLAAIVGDGRSSAAHMLRAQGLTFEEAIKALQRALSATSPAAAPAAAPAVKADKPDKPDAEDIIATARARVQTRAAPGLPPPAPRVEQPTPLAGAAVEGQSVPAVESVVPAVTGRGTDSAPAPWPPEVRRSEPVGERGDTSPDFDAIQQQIARERHISEDAERAAAEADAAAYDAAPAIAGPQFTTFDDFVPYTGPPSPPALPPVIPAAPTSRVMPQPGSRWPAAVAPAWKDQPGHTLGGPDQSGFAQPPSPLVTRTAEGIDRPPPLPTGQFQADFGHAPRQSEWPAADAGHDSGDYHGQPSGAPSYQVPPSAPDLHEMPFDQGYAPAPPPVPQGMGWPNDQQTNGPPAHEHGPGFDPALSETGATGHDVYHSSWPHQEPAAQWAGPPVPEAIEGTELNRLVPGPSWQARGQDASGAPPLPRGPRRRKADRVAVGQMGDGIARRMRTLVATSIDVRLGRAEMASLIDGLADDGRELALASLSVKLRAPEGRFLIEPLSPETQWLPEDGGQPDGAHSSWRWTVTPLKAGRRRLQLAVWARTVSADGAAVVTPFPDQTIEVRVAANYARVLGRIVLWGVLAGAGWLAAAYGGAVYGPVVAEVMKMLK